MPIDIPYEFFKREYDEQSVAHWAKVCDRFKCCEWIKQTKLPNGLPCLVVKVVWHGANVERTLSSKRDWENFKEYHFVNVLPYTYIWDRYPPRKAEFVEKKIHPWIKDYKELD